MNKYKKNLIGNIRYWTFKKDLLWFGDKCYHMVEHSFKHIMDDWNNMNQILQLLIFEKGKEEIFGKDEDGYGDKLIYAFCMAIWLHDIGHKGSDVYGEPHLIRDNHGYISGELILKYPSLFRIEEPDNYYELQPSKGFPLDMPSLLELMLRRKKEYLTVTEMIALFCIYHKSNVPIDEEDYKNILISNKRIPIEYYVGGNRGRKNENIITLEKILERRVKGKNGENKRKFLSLTALFRFVDSIDIRNVRVGDITEKNLKEAVIENDKRFLFKKCKKEIERLTGDTNPVLSATFIKTFYEDIKEKIERGEFTQLEIPKELLKNPELLENYEALIDYAAYIAFQPTHFNLHMSIESIYLNLGCLDITLVTDKEKDWLESHKIRERGRKEQSIYERLIGKECYIIKEIEGVKTHLKEFFPEVRIVLVNKKNERIEEMTWKGNKK